MEAHVRRILLGIPPHLGDELDWKTRVADLVGSDVAVRQPSYDEQSLYPDGALKLREDAFTSSIAESLAREIYDHIICKGYSRELIYINSHGTDAVCRNSDEHEDHRITGNAVLKAIEILLGLGIGSVCASWFIIYSPIIARKGYSREKADVSAAKEQKSRLCRACWETEFLAQHVHSQMKSWGKDLDGSRYPENPSDFEYRIKIIYTKKIQSSCRAARSKIALFNPA